MIYVEDNEINIPAGIGHGTSEFLLQEKTIDSFLNSSTSSTTKDTIEIVPDASYSGLSKITLRGLTKYQPTVDASINTFSVYPSRWNRDVFTGFAVRGVDASIDSNIQASNIKSGVTILGVEGTYAGDKVNAWMYGISLAGTQSTGYYNIFRVISLATPEYVISGNTLGMFENARINNTIDFPNDTDFPLLYSSGKAFKNSNGLTYLRSGENMIPEGVTSIGNETFYNCHLLLKNIPCLNLPSTLTSIGTNAFAGAGDYVTSIDGRRTLRFNTPNPPTGWNGLVDLFERCTTRSISSGEFGRWVIIPNGRAEAYADLIAEFTSQSRTNAWYVAM